MRFLNTVIADIQSGENIDVYLTILICAVVVIVDLFGVVQPGIITAVILLTLSLLSFGALTTRKTLGELNTTIQRIEDGQGAEAFFKDRNAYAPLPETTALARQIYFAGPTLINLFSQWAGYFQFEKLNKQGATIQAILLDPDSPAIASAAKCINEPPENVRKDIERTLSYIEIMVKDEDRAGSIEARLMSAYPNFGMVLIDPDEPNGRMFVEFTGYCTRIHTRPHIELTRQRDGVWYEYFLQQYRKLWEDSQVRPTSQD